MMLVAFFATMTAGVHANAGASPRRVMAWMSADCFTGDVAHSCLGQPADNTTDIERQASEAIRRASAKQLTDLSPTTYKFGPNGTVLYDRCGVVCERLQPKFAGAGLRVLPLVAAFGIRPIVEYALKHPTNAAHTLVNLTLTHGYAGINLDLEPLDCQNCVLSEFFRFRFTLLKNKC